MAASLNKVMLIGRLGQDPRLAYLPSGSPVVNFSLATDESYTDREGNRIDKAEWHRIVAFDRQAEFCANYLSKGRLIFVEGKLRTRKWQDQQGQDRYTTEIVAFRVQALDPKGQQTESYVPAPETAPQKPEESMEEDLGPAFPSEAGAMDDAPF